MPHARMHACTHAHIFLSMSVVLLRVSLLSLQAEQGRMCQQACLHFKENEMSDHRAVLKRKKAVEERKEFIEKEREEKVYLLGHDYLSHVIVLTMFTMLLCRSTRNVRSRRRRKRNGASLSRSDWSETRRRERKRSRRRRLRR